MLVYSIALQNDVRGEDPDSFLGKTMVRSCLFFVVCLAKSPYAYRQITSLPLLSSTPIVTQYIKSLRRLRESFTWMLYHPIVVGCYRAQ